MTRARPLVERFEALTDRSAGDAGCHIWLGAKLPKGYGRIGMGGRIGKLALAHRVAWELANERPVPTGLQVMHSCDRPSCVNPAHLSAGTQLENSADMIRKGRRVAKDSRGAMNPIAKLTDTAVREIRAEYAAGGVTLLALANRYEVNRSCIHKIVIGESWRHVA